MQFSKMHGLGNDFMVVDAVTQNVFFSPELIRRLADRHLGIGFDQLLIVEPPYDPDLDFHYRIFNADGSEVTQCGNGARCFARFVRLKGLTNKSEIRVSTQTGRMVLSVTPDELVRVNMGEPNFEPQQVPFRANKAENLYLLRVAEQAPARTLAAFAVRLPRWPGKLWQAAGLFARSYRADSYVLAALGEERLEAVRLREGGRVREIACERLACGFGLVPNVQLGQALGYRLDGQALAVDEWQAGSLPDHYAAGECTGFGGSELALVEGAIAGHAAVDERDAARRLWPRRRRWQGFADTLARHFALRAGLRELAEADTLVCRCEDVPLAALAGHAGWTEAKLYSRCGMGACQGRICGGAAQFLFGWTPPAPRPPFSPARLETLACWQGDAG